MNSCISGSREVSDFNESMQLRICRCSCRAFERSINATVPNQNWKAHCDGSKPLS
nr:MAG TPA: hypothetical protein [Caudoviricetes sp.]